jgi:hypothetical protein
VERYDAASDTWRAVADMLEGRGYFNALAVDSLITKAALRSP